MIEAAVLTVIVAIVVFAVVYYKTRDREKEVTYSSHPYYPYDSQTPRAFPGYHPAETIYDPTNNTIRSRRYSQGGLAIEADYDDDETPPLVYIPATREYDSPNVNVAEPSTTGDFPSPQTVSDNLSDTLERASETVSHGLKTDWSGGGSGDIYRDSGSSGGGNVGFDSGTPDVKPSGSYTRIDTYPTSSTDSTSNVVSSEVSSTSSGSGFDGVSGNGLDTGSSNISPGSD